LLVRTAQPACIVDPACGEGFQRKPEVRHCAGRVPVLERFEIIDAPRHCPAARDVDFLDPLDRVDLDLAALQRPFIHRTDGLHHVVGLGRGVRPSVARLHPGAGWGLHIVAAIAVAIIVPDLAHPSKDAAPRPQGEGGPDAGRHLAFEMIKVSSDQPFQRSLDWLRCLGGHPFFTFARGPIVVPEIGMIGADRNDDLAAHLALDPDTVPDRARGQFFGPIARKIDTHAPCPAYHFFGPKGWGDSGFASTAKILTVPSGAISSPPGGVPMTARHAFSALRITDSEGRAAGMSGGHVVDANRGRAGHGLAS
jgi:hypothetical protein